MQGASNGSRGGEKPPEHSGLASIRTEQPALEQMTKKQREAQAAIIACCTIPEKELKKLVEMNLVKLLK